ncbi:T9SS type A sorting domain-containing protein [Flavobacterium sedimenticola]|uniref:T9SS type A sorting domain-containing protein n=1 Tax=Flavobacterium sedimenticola TaxID=3043286 RepID=A0ABT6XQT6_9FLAO|nr:T9SS type A sorting domain-containing protein [Flavobacterium sedimenticola]MDI9257388.1 T9SS type A sorting domain-containing protein [Flavobacterium sedimenticola]
MKKVFLLLVTLTVTQLSFAQSEKNPDWMHHVDITNSDSAVDFWVNPNGESYALTRITNYGGQLDALALVKTNDSGQEVWKRFLYAVNNDWQLFANAVIGDESGNIYVMFNEKTRYTDSNRNRIVIRKYNANGDIIWNQYLSDSVENRTEEAARRVFEYKNGALYVLGSMYGENVWTTQGSDGILYKVQSDSGAIVFRKVYNSQYNSDDMLKDMAVNDAGEVWTIGRSRGYAYTGGVYSHYDSVALKWDANGNLLWERRLNGTGNAEDFGINLTIDTQGNCYTSSQLKRIGINALQVVIEKLSPSGTPVWTAASISSSTGYTAKQPVELLPNGNVVFAATNENGINIVALNGDDGLPVWNTNFNRNNLGAQNRQSDMAIDHNGNIFITGSSRDNTPYGNGIDMTTLKYSMSGEFLWFSYVTHGNYATAGDFGDVTRWNPSNQSLYVLGSVQDANFNTNFVVAKYGETALEVPTVSKSVSLYPNPVKELLHLDLNLNQDCDVVLFDINGRMIKKWELGARDTNYSVDLSDVVRGIYILKVSSDDFTHSQKIIKS